MPAAGVQRLTVYRHFPNEAAVIQACSATFLERNPPPTLPDPDAPEPDQPWLEEALRALYEYNRRTHRMWEAVLRDAAQMETLREPLAQVADYFKAYGSALLRRLRRRGEPRRELRAAVALALTFGTWSTLADQGISDKSMARMMAAWLDALAPPATNDARRA
jgi:AcrR family transcriptional regulator